MFLSDTLEINQKVSKSHSFLEVNVCNNDFYWAGKQLDVQFTFALLSYPQWDQLLDSHLLITTDK